MKGPKILRSTVLLLALIIVVALVGRVGQVEAEEIQVEENYYVDCGHYKWVDVRDGGGFWLTSDATSLLPKLTQDEHPFATEGELVLVIGRSSFALFGVPLDMTWGCHYVGGYYPPQDMVDGIVEGLYKDPLCVYVDEFGGVTVENTVGGTCLLPDAPVTPTDTPEPTTEPTCEPTIDPTIDPTEYPTATVKPGKAWQTPVP